MVDERAAGARAALVRGLLLLAQLGQQPGQPRRYRQAQGGQVFQNAEAFVGEVEKDHRRAQRGAGAAEQGGVEQVAEADDDKDQDFFKDATPAPGGRQPPLAGGGDKTGQVVNHHKAGQAQQKAVPAAQKGTGQAAEQGPEQIDWGGQGFDGRITSFRYYRFVGANRVRPDKGGGF